MGDSSSGACATTIDGFGESFDIIRTKTRPKRLLILGSDGVAYPYLLKSPRRT